MASTGTSAAPAPLCCEHHGDHQKHDHDHHYLDMPFIKKMKEKSGNCNCLLVVYIFFAVALLIVALAEVIVTVTKAMMINVLSTESLGCLVGTVILAICAGVVSVAAIYGIVAACKKNGKGLHTVSIIIVVVVIVEILLISFAVSIKKDDDRNIATVLTRSFLKAIKQNDEASIELWDVMQSSMECCGLYGPNDYKDPDYPSEPLKVPHSCCVVSQKNETVFYGKWERDICEFNTTYYTEGCLKTVRTIYKEAVKITVGITILFIILEIIVSSIGFWLAKKSSKKEKKDTEAPNNTPEPKPKS